MEKLGSKGKRILVVDDNPDNLGVVAGYLKNAGYKVAVAPNGSIALEQAARIKPLVILLDVKMPGMDGFEVCRELKKVADTSDIPVIFLTALDDIKSITRGFQAGGTDYLSKPVNKDELLARVLTQVENYLYKNKLKEEVRLRTAELERYHERLEELVDERTHELEAAQEELVKRERLAVLGQLTATVSHELRNPLSVIRSSAFYLQRKLPDPDEKTLKHLMRIDSQVETCDAIVGDLLEYTRSLPAEKSKEEITLWLRRLLDDFCETINVQVNYQPAADILLVLFDREKMRRVMLNLLTNAVQAVAEHKRQAQKKGDAYQGSIKILTWSSDDHVVVQVEDNGIGMDDETQDRAFEPLFTTKARGTGIGLALVKKVVKEHDGSVAFESRPQEGTKIRIMLPLSEKVIV
jgi:signal transduction histidine kinase